MDSIQNYVAMSKITKSIKNYEKQIHVLGMRFKLYLGNWTTNHFEIRSVARSKVAIMLSGPNSIL